jgi:predicted amidohydrolase
MRVLFAIVVICCATVQPAAGTLYLQRVSCVFVESLSSRPILAGYTAAVVQHTPIIGKFPEETITANLALYTTVAAAARAAGAQIINFPEFGLGMNTENCSSPQLQKSSTFCESVTVPLGTLLCGNATAAAATPIQQNASCIAQANGLWLGINTCERGAAGAYNTELVFAPNGTLVGVYRKMHPWFTKCFLPGQNLVTVDATADLGVTLGLMTCYDILFDRWGRGVTFRSP